MSFTYNPEVISTDLAKVRTIIFDTDSSDALLTDEQINYFLTVNSNVFAAAALAARTIQAQFARQADISIESVAKKFSQKSAQYAKLADNLDKQATQEDLVSPSNLGVSIEETDEQRAESDRRQEKFFVDKFSNPPEGTLPNNGADP